MENSDFWAQIQNIIDDGFSPEGLEKLDRYAELFINRSSGLSDFYHRNSMAAQKEVLFMSLRPYSREQKLAQIARLKDSPNSKENSNSQRRKAVL